MLSVKIKFANNITMWVIHTDGDVCIAHVVRCLLYLARAPTPGDASVLPHRATPHPPLRVFANELAEEEKERRDASSQKGICY